MQHKHESAYAYARVLQELYGICLFSALLGRGAELQWRATHDLCRGRSKGSLRYFGPGVFRGKIFKLADAFFRLIRQ